jgi:energy-coupling factor transport system ATP-binding protein
MVLDEPYANLDFRGEGLVRESLKRLREREIAVVVVEQRPETCLDDAERCIVMDNGKVVFDGPPDSARQTLRKEGLTPDYSTCRPPERKPSANGGTSNGQTSNRAPFLKVENLSRSIDGNQVLGNVSLEIHQGEAVALVGRNGSGKTTLLKHLNGLYPARTGGVFFDGENIRTKTPMQRAALAGISFQNANDQFFKTRVLDELRVGLGTMRGTDGDRNAWLQQICETFRLGGLLESPPFKLSEGEKKRVAVCSILAMKPRLLVLDEPTAGQDGRQRQTLAGILRGLNREGATILIATHDLDFARAVADRWVVLKNGTVAADASPEEIGWE